MKICRTKGCGRKSKAKGLCSRCYRKRYYISIPRFGSQKRLKGQKSIIHTNRDAQEFKDIVKKIREKVLDKAVNDKEYMRKLLEV